MSREEPVEIEGEAKIEDCFEGVLVGIVRHDVTGEFLVGLQVFEDFLPMTPDEARRLASSLEGATGAFSAEFPLVPRDLRHFADEVEQRRATRQ